MESGRILLPHGAVNKSRKIGLRPAFVAAVAAWASLGLAISCRASETAEDVFLHLQTTVVLLSDSPAAPWSAADLVSIEELRKTINFLQDRFSVGQGDLPSSYLATLRNDDELMRQSMASTDVAQRRDLLQDALQDLTLKKTFLQKSAGFSSFLASNMLVKVFVFTKNAGAPVNGYSVRCNPRRYKSDAYFREIFNTLTSPSKGVLPPGIFSCVVDNGNGKIYRQDISVGLSGKNEEIVDVGVAKP